MEEIGGGEMNDVPSKQQAISAVDTLVRYIESVNGELREGLARTPERVIESFVEIYSGYSGDAKSILDATFNSEGYDGIVLLRDIEFHSVCEHHLLPFSGKAHIAYIPTDRIVGISKLARLLDLHSSQLQNQERVTKGVADDIENILAPLGCAVILEASHDCMQCRGVSKQNAVMTTSAMRGVFFDKLEARGELLQLINTQSER
jgi:GTP cyclohydrolase I|tara:strand:- start:1463 stop:2074 length:612 start_codon:yes stop_codon:yes gene_type:complete